MKTWQRFLDETIPSTDQQEKLQQFFAEHLMRAPGAETSVTKTVEDRS